MATFTLEAANDSVNAQDAAAVLRASLPSTYIINVHAAQVTINTAHGTVPVAEIQEKIVAACLRVVSVDDTITLP